MNNSYNYISKKILVIFLLFCCMKASGQNFDDFSKLYRQIRYSDILRLSRQNTNIISSFGIYEIIGNSYFHLGKYDSSAYFLNLAIAKDCEEVSMLSYLNLGQSDLIIGKKEEGIAQFNRLIALKKNRQDTISSLINE